MLVIILCKVERYSGMAQANLRLAIRAYLSTSNSTIKQFVYDILASEATSVFFAQDEPDLTSGQKWDAHQPLKTERIGRFLRGDQDRLSTEDASAIKAFLINLKFVDSSFEIEDDGSSESAALHIALSEYANARLSNRFYGETLIGRPRYTLGVRAASLTFWNETQILPLVRIKLLFDGEAFASPRWHPINSPVGTRTATRDSSDSADFMSVPVFKPTGDIVCNFFQPTRFADKIFSAEIKLLDKYTSPSAYIATDFFRSVFCANFKFMLRYINKRDIQKILTIRSRALRAYIAKNQSIKEGVIENKLLESSRKDNILDFISALQENVDVNARNARSGYGVAHVACLCASSHILTILYGKWSDVILLVNKIFGESNLYGAEEALQALENARRSFDPLAYDASGRLPSSLVPKLTEMTAVGSEMRRIHTIVFSAELFAAGGASSSLMRDYTLDLS